MAKFFLDIIKQSGTIRSSKVWLVCGMRLDFWGIQLHHQLVCPRHLQRHWAALLQHSVSTGDFFVGRPRGERATIGTSLSTRNEPDRRLYDFFHLCVPPLPSCCLEQDQDRQFRFFLRGPFVCSRRFRDLPQGCTPNWSPDYLRWEAAALEMWRFGDLLERPVRSEGGVRSSAQISPQREQPQHRTLLCRRSKIRPQSHSTWTSNSLHRGSGRCRPHYWWTSVQWREIRRTIPRSSDVIAFSQLFSSNESLLSSLHLLFNIFISPHCWCSRPSNSSPLGQAISSV